MREVGEQAEGCEACYRGPWYGESALPRIYPAPAFHPFSLFTPPLNEPHPELQNMKLVALVLALLGAASGLLLSPPALLRAGSATRHPALLMQEEEKTVGSRPCESITPQPWP